MAIIVLFLLGAAMAERFIFFASAGFCLVIALLLERLLARYNITGTAILNNNKTRAILIPICVVFIAMTISRNSDWVDGYTLYQTDVKRSPADARLHTYLGNELYTIQYSQTQDPSAKTKILNEAINNFRQAIAIYPDYESAHENIGNVFFMTQQLDSAEVHDKKVIELNPINAVACNNLAGIYFNRQQYAEALGLCRKIISISPDKIDIYGNMGVCFMNLKQYDSAVVYFKKLIAAGEANRSSYTNLAQAFYQAGQPDSANKYGAFAK